MTRFPTKKFSFVCYGKRLSDIKLCAHRLVRDTILCEELLTVSGLGRVGAVNQGCDRGHAHVFVCLDERVLLTVRVLRKKEKKGAEYLEQLGSSRAIGGRLDQGVGNEVLELFRPLFLVLQFRRRRVGDFVHGSHGVEVIERGLQ